MKDETNIRSTYNKSEGNLIRKVAKKGGWSLQSFQRIATIEKANALK